MPPGGAYRVKLTKDKNVTGAIQYVRVTHEPELLQLQISLNDIEPD